MTQGDAFIFVSTHTQKKRVWVNPTKRYGWCHPQGGQRSQAYLKGKAGKFFSQHNWEAKVKWNTALTRQLDEAKHARLLLKKEASLEAL